MTKDRTYDGTSNIDWGTEERRKHSKLKTTVRDISNSGNVITTGLTDTQHCYLDYLLNEEFINQAEYDTAYKLRELYYSFKPSEGVSKINDRGSSKTTQVMDSEIGDVADMLETKYTRIMMHIPCEWRQLIRKICIEDGLGKLPKRKNVHSINFAIYLLEKGFLNYLKNNKDFP